MRRKIILSIAFVLTLIIAFPIVTKASSENLYLNSLNFEAEINYDGSMNVTEIWNIDISNTNTLFKTFKTDRKKYTGITDVKVTEITNNITKEFEQVNQYMYHVTKNYYYGLENPDGDFEIAWGIGLDNSSDERVYKIQYKVKDAVAKYNDYAELYWQFIGENFEISAKKVKGTIMLPSNASSKEDIKVWGHTKDLNGTIYATDLNKIEFEVDNYRSRRYLEIRTLFPNNLITYSGRTYNFNILQKAIAEETEWAEEANRQRELKKNSIKAILIGGFIISIIISVIYINKTRKYSKVLKKLKKYEPTNKLEYFRDLPDNDATPEEAIFLLESLYNDFNRNFGEIFSATILNLSLNKCIELKIDENEKGKKAIKIRNLNNTNIILKEEEKKIFEFLIKAMKNTEEITIFDLEKYIRSHTSSVVKLIQDTHKYTQKSVTAKGYFDDKEYDRYENYMTKTILYIVFGAIFIALLPASIVLIINAIYCYKISKRINVLTQEGLDQKEMWKGLKKYMQDFSLLKEREVLELVIWEKYLVYATAFGIADKVIKQLKMVYPNIDEINGVNTSSYMYFIYHSDFTKNFSNVINNSIQQATYSSGNGAGGGFSSGGGRRRRRPVEVAEDNLSSFAKELVKK